MSRHAVVIGGGIGGLLAARALTDRFERITIVERGHYPDLEVSSAPPVRQGVPQSRCLHLLMAAGAAAFDVLSPGWREKLVKMGALPFDASADAETRIATGWLPRSPSGNTLYACSRSLIEHVLRHDFEQGAQLRLRTGVRVVGLLYDRSNNRVTGVHTRQALPGSTVREFHADLVVDGSGLTSALPRWLTQCLPHSRQNVQSGAGDLQSIDTTIEPGRRYVSSWFHIAEQDAPDWQCLSIAPGLLPHEHRSAMMLRAEYDHWGVVLVDSSPDPLPTDHHSFLEFTEELGEGKLTEALLKARPVSPVHRLRPAANRWQHYERMSLWPSGLVALGDSVCALDPYFGLGMTVAARSAVLLRNFVDVPHGSSLNGRTFQYELAQLNAQPWQLATGCDTDGRPLSSTGGQTERSSSAAASETKLTHAILTEQHLSSSLGSMMKIKSA